LQPAVLLFTADGFPAVMAHTGSSMQANLNLLVQDFSLLMNAGFAPSPTNRPFVSLA